MSDDERRQVARGASYLYSFHVDRASGAFEIVGKGCTDGSVGPPIKTELVVRGQRGAADTDALVVLRRAPSDF